MSIKEMTPLEYSRKLGISKQAVFKRINKEDMNYLPHVLEIKRFQKQFILVVQQPVRKLSKKVA